jgi:hypothetical protein
MTSIMRLTEIYDIIDLMEISLDNNNRTYPAIPNQVTAPSSRFATMVTMSAYVLRPRCILMGKTDHLENCSSSLGVLSKRPTRSNEVFEKKKKLLIGLQRATHVRSIRSERKRLSRCKTTGNV